MPTNPGEAFPEARAPGWVGSMIQPSKEEGCGTVLGRRSHGDGDSSLVLMGGTAGLRKSVFAISGLG